MFTWQTTMLKTKTNSFYNTHGVRLNARVEHVPRLCSAPAASYKIDIGLDTAEPRAGQCGLFVSNFFLMTLLTVRFSDRHKSTFKRYTERTTTAARWARGQ